MVSIDCRYRLLSIDYAWYSSCGITENLPETGQLNNVAKNGIREFKKRGRVESETRPEVTFPISDEKSMRAAFSTRLGNAT